ncbi:MAG: hypothetical protein Q8O75_01575 [bacterium]|nr:hypothetical protein [bacterium]
MPLVTVYYWRTLSPLQMALLGQKIPVAVANHLTIDQVREAWLIPDDIEVLFQKGDPRDVRHSDIAIRVEAMHLRHREKIVNDAAKEIGEDVDQILEGLTFFVWIVLAHAGYYEQRREQ